MNRIALRSLSGFFLFFILVSQVYAGEHWLIGTWELFHDPDGNEKDWIEFSEKGDVTAFTENKQNQVYGTYKVDSGAVRIEYDLYGQTVPITLTYQDNKESLFVFSARTGNTSTYKKLP